jgi:hypothetical protein
MKILYFRELMGMTFPPVDMDEEFAQGKFAENRDEVGNHTSAFMVEYRPYAPNRKVLFIMTPSTAAMTQVMCRDDVNVTPEYRNSMRFYVCPVATLTMETLKKLLKECNPSHLMVDPDVLDKEHKRLFYSKSGHHAVFKKGEHVPSHVPSPESSPAYMKVEDGECAA